MMLCPSCGERMYPARVYGRGAFECEECDEVCYAERKHDPQRLRLPQVSQHVQDAKRG